MSNAVTYLAFIADSSCSSPPTPAGPFTTRAKHQIRDALAYIRGQPRILLALSVVFFVGTFGMNFQLTSALMAQQEFGLGAEAYGLLGTFMAVGSLAGALVAARRVRAPRGRYLVAMGLGFGAVEVVAGLMPTYVAYAVCPPAHGSRRAAHAHRGERLRPAGVDPALRGRVMALYATVLMGGTPSAHPSSAGSVRCSDRAGR